MQSVDSSATNDVVPIDSLSTPACEETSQRAVAAEAPRNHLAFLDGIRGLSALYVVLFHCAVGREGLGATGRWLTGWMAYGRFAVDVFIVLSGYCLMLPVARSADGRLRGGAAAYLKRRARRILPPYYAALLLAVALVWIGRYVKHEHVARLTADPIALTPANLLTHGLLVHNLFESYCFALNPVLWTVALEWQIYFLFPLLLALWRRSGPMVTVAVSCLIGLMPLLLPRSQNLAWTCPWFVGLFAMGMAAAVLTEGKQESAARVLRRSPWALLSLAFLAALLPCPWLRHQRWWINDLFIGAAAACLILHCVRRLRAPGAKSPGLLVRLLESPPAVTLGQFSYSLYLIHVPIVWVLMSRPLAPRLSGTVQFAMGLGIKIPIIIALAYVFYRVFERPFTSSAARAPAKA